MRVGRFSGLSDSGPEPIPPLSPASLLLFDFLPAGDQHDERVACERLHSIAHSAPFLAVAHLVCGIVLLVAHREAGVMPDPLLFGVPLAAVLLLDLRLWSLTARRARPTRPHAVTRLTAVYAVLGAILWLVVLAAVVESGIGPGSPAARSAVVAGFAATVAAFVSIPLLVLISCAAGIAAAALFSDGWSMLAMGCAFSVCLLGLSLVRTRDAIRDAHRRLVGDWEAGQATRFVAAFEQSGRGWFWETNADGALTYLSETMAEQLGRSGDELIGRRFSELLLVEDSGQSENERPTLGFHLSARFPFSEVIVTPNGRRDVCWSLSGSPTFDDLGRFLGFRGIGENLGEERRAQVMTSKLARIDSLTGLPNRAAMRKMLDEALANSESRRQGCALMLIDLDRFKAVNDTLGHPVGDVLLKQVAQRLSGIFADVGQVGRLGGDEFEAVLPAEEQEGRLAALAERLIQQVSKPYLIRGHTITIGASVGIAVARPGKAYADAMVRDADLALYAAKAAGRGTFRLFDPDMHNQATDRQILQSDLEDALAKGELRLLYHPVVEAASEDLSGFEALLRWAHPVRGQLAPAEFLGIAEESGLIEGIGEWVLRNACEEAAQWPRHLRLAVNVSPVQLRNPGLAATIANALASSGLEPDRLELDLNEEALLADSLQASEAVASLKALGVRLALDDFGSGASSLASLRTVPLDRIKVDQGFLRSAQPERSRNRALLGSIVALAGGLDMEVTAEGAETLEDLTLARKLGFSHVQGFLFGRPMAAPEARALAAKASAMSANEAKRGRPPRHSLIRVGTLRSAGEEFPVRLRNISGGGAMVEGDRAIAIGAEVQLALEDGLMIPAEVRWCEEERIGLKFTEAFDLRRIGRPRSAPPGLKMLRPAYLDSETSPESPWASRQERLSIRDVQRR
jgi:diguanylate cyclase (GGDEF)-like protein/PAS domain S-box-containing protein